MNDRAGRVRAGHDSQSANSRSSEVSAEWLNSGGWTTPRGVSIVAGSTVVAGMNTATTGGVTPSRLLRTREEIRAAGRAHGKTLAPLTEAQINLLATLLAPTLNASRAAKRGAK